MEFIVSSLFSEVGSYFSISHKVDLKIREKLNESIKFDVQQALEGKEKEALFINLMVSTNKSTVAVEAKGPDYNRRDKIINWGLWLPYEAIVSNKDQRIPYVKFYFDALVDVLNKYGISEEKVREIQKSVESEIVENHEFDFKEAETIEVDLSDLDLD